MGDHNLDDLLGELGEPAHTPDDAPGEGGGDAAWQFTEGACRRVLGALLSDLKQTLSTDGGRRALAERYGAKVCAALAEIMIRLDAGEPGDS